jgi:RNA polymerase sigma factor (sigma-70 family)
VRREGRGLLGFEEADDLVQGVNVRALASSESFTWRGEIAFKGWLITLAKRHVADRNDHWKALKRGAGRIVRLTRSGAGTHDQRGVAPAFDGPGPRTFASQREALMLASRALAALSEKDRQLVRWSSEGVDSATQAERLGISQEAVRKAGTRALERLRKTFRLLNPLARV